MYSDDSVGFIVLYTTNPMSTAYPDLAGIQQSVFGGAPVPLGSDYYHTTFDVSWVSIQVPWLQVIDGNTGEIVSADATTIDQDALQSLLN